jgi:hypothetical protein
VLTVDRFFESFSNIAIPSFGETIDLLEGAVFGFGTNFQDGDGNGLMHLVIKALVEKLAVLYQPFQGRRNVYVSDLPHDSAKGCVKSAILLINKLLELGAPCDSVNFQGARPLDILINAEISFCDIKEFAQQLLPLFESKGKLYPGRKYVTSLNFFRGSKQPSKICPIPDAFPLLDSQDGAKVTLHERQAFYENYLRFQGKTGGAINLVVANLGFVISNLAKAAPGHKPVFLTIPICVDNYLTFAEKHNKGTHSEGALCTALSDPNYLALLLRQLASMHGFVSGQKIYSIVLDLHSTAEVCKDCQRLLHDLQTNYAQGSFLKELENLAVKFGYLLPQRSYVDGSANGSQPRLRVTVRASGVRHPGWRGNDISGIPLPVASVNPQQDIKLHPQVVMFHLPPSWTFNECTNFANGNDERILQTYKPKERDHYHKAFDGLVRAKQETDEESERQKYKELIEMLAESQYPQQRICFFNQTAFANTGGKTISVRGSSSTAKMAAVSIEDSQVLEALQQSLII